MKGSALPRRARSRSCARAGQCRTRSCRNQFLYESRRSIGFAPPKCIVQRVKPSIEWIRQVAGKCQPNRKDPGCASVSCRLVAGNL